MNKHCRLVLPVLLFLGYACTQTTAGIKTISPVAPNDTAKTIPSDPLKFNVSADSVIKANHIPLEKIRIEISKTNYRLQLISDTFLIKTYKCIFGLNPVDDKKMEGDKCTPEGTFKVIMKFPRHEWYKFIWFDYPNADSWKKFNDRKSRGEIPANASIGGKVGIHGAGNGDDRYDHNVDSRNNWTWGCVNLKNKDLDEVFDIVEVGTKVVIRH